MRHLKELFNEVKEEYGESIALGVVCILTINLTKTVENRHIELANLGSFTSEIIDEFKLFALGIFKEEEVETIINIWHKTHTWIIQKELDGMGGAKAVSIKELMNETVRNSERS